MAPVVKALQATAGVVPVVCVTGQHREMLEQVLTLFQIEPDFDLKLMRDNQSLSGLTATAIIGVTRIIEEVMPKLVLVHGDTTSTFAAGLAAFYKGIPVGHVEAGLRTGDIFAPWPEEFNRCAVDLFCDFLWALCSSP